jgi:hypothetical protein
MVVVQEADKADLEWKPDTESYTIQAICFKLQASDGPDRYSPSSGPRLGVELPRFR